MSEDPVDPPLAGLPTPREATRLVGHEQTLGAITKAWQQKRLHHALLLTGLRGIGKATLGYAVAKMVIGQASDPGSGFSTRSARQIASGASQQFRRLARSVAKDGKVRNVISVDDVRAIEPFLRQRAEAGAWRVVLVDAVDDLNPNSANALLKLLEEPGERTLFLLVAHSEGRVLPTLRSRCLVMRMRGLADAEVREVLMASDVKENEIKAVLSKADGSVRRAIVLATSGGVEALDRMERMLARSEWAAPEAYAIADLAGARDGEAIYHEIANGLPALLSRRAVSEAKVGRLTKASNLSNTASAVATKLALDDEYGVDRRLSVRAALDEAHRVLNA